MSKYEIKSKNTNLQAYRLVHDPVQLFCLLFLKYGLVTEDFFISYINQLLFNDISHYSILYKEHIYSLGLVEYIKKFYKYIDSQKLIIKISKHNKNYYKFFSKPIFTDFYFNKFLGNYYDDKAEIFYFNDFSGKKNTKIMKENELKNAINYNISSFDNDTQIHTIFNKTMRKMIDNNLNIKDITISLSVNTKEEFDNSKKIITSESSKTICDNLFVTKCIKEKPNEKQNKNDMNEKDNKLEKENKINENIEQNNITKIMQIFSKNITNSNKNLKNTKNINNSIHRNLDIKKNENTNFKEKSDHISINKKENYLEINSPRIIYDKSMNLNNLNNFSPLYKKPKVKMKNKLEIFKKSSSKKQISILNINTLKKPQQTTKFNLYSPKNNKIKYFFNDLKSSLTKKIERPELKLDSNFSNNIRYRKPELPTINRENSVKKYNNNSGLLSDNKRISKKIKLNAYPFKNSNFIIIKKGQINKINAPRINLNKFSIDLKGINQVKNASNFSHEKIFDKNINLIPNNKEKKKFNYIKNNFLKKLRPSYSMNKEIESFNNDIKTIDLNNKINKNLSRNTINNNMNIKSQNQIVDEKQQRSNNIKNKKVIYPINLIKATNHNSKIN